MKFCGNDPSTNQQICYTTRDFVSDQGQPALAVAIYDLTGKPEKIARFILPLGLLLTPGIRFSVDQSGAAEGKFVVCLPNGCFAEGQTTEAFINGMKKGTSLNVKFRNQGGEVTFQVPLAGFGKAFDGAPVDPKIVEEQQKKLQEELQKRSDELRSKLGGFGGRFSGSGRTRPPRRSPSPLLGRDLVSRDKLIGGERRVRRVSRLARSRIFSSVVKPAITWRAITAGALKAGALFTGSLHDRLNQLRDAAFIR